MLDQLASLEGGDLGGVFADVHTHEVAAHGTPLAGATTTALQGLLVELDRLSGCDGLDRSGSVRAATALPALATPVVALALLATLALTALAASAASASPAATTAFAALTITLALLATLSTLRLSLFLALLLLAVVRRRSGTGVADLGSGAGVADLRGTTAARAAVRLVGLGRVGSVLTRSVLVVVLVLLSGGGIAASVVSVAALWAGTLIFLRGLFVGHRFRLSDRASAGERSCRPRGCRHRRSNPQRVGALVIVGDDPLVKSVNP